MGNWIIQCFFAGDHGYWYGEHGLNEEPRLAYEEALRVPMMDQVSTIDQKGINP